MRRALVLGFLGASACAPPAQAGPKGPWEATVAATPAARDLAVRVPLRPRPVPSAVADTGDAGASEVELPEPPSCGSRECADACAMGDGAACFAIYVATHDDPSPLVRDAALVALRRGCILGEPRACAVTVGGRAPGRDDSRAVSTGCKPSPPVRLPNP